MLHILVSRLFSLLSFLVNCFFLMFSSFRSFPIKFFWLFLRLTNRLVLFLMFYNPIKKLREFINSSLFKLYTKYSYIVLFANDFLNRVLADNTTATSPFPDVPVTGKPKTPSIIDSDDEDEDLNDDDDPEEEEMERDRDEGLEEQPKMEWSKLLEYGKFFPEEDGSEVQDDTDSWSGGSLKASGEFADLL